MLSSDYMTFKLVRLLDKQVLVILFHLYGFLILVRTINAKALKPSSCQLSQTDNVSQTAASSETDQGQIRARSVPRLTAFGVK